MIELRHRSVHMAMKWRVTLVVSAAIAISYLDRQSLPVAVAAIQQDIPLTNTQFGALTLGLPARLRADVRGRRRARRSARHAARLSRRS